jgi:dihydroorotate dehydrogenase (NAD+) catalytic subunit
VILNGSGCLDALASPDVARQLDAFVTKTVTPLPREGNEPVRIAEVETGMLNSIGLANPGIDGFLAETLPRLLELDVPVWVSVGGFTADDYAEVCDRLDRTPVDVLELNVSCPNVKAPNAETARIVSAARQATQKPVYAKLSPALPDVAAAAVAAAEAGAAGLTLVNTLKGLSLDGQLRPVLSTAAGGLSGPALRPVALAAVHACYRATALPIVGLGGVSTGRHALELFAAGASAVAIGTTLFADPFAPARIRAELRAELEALGLDEPLQARGLAHSNGDPLLPDQKKTPAN